MHHTPQLPELVEAELIDTCWDVNAFKFRLSKLDSIGINRYMLGCKYDTDDSEQDNTEELIDTCWDVNIISIQSARMMLRN